MKQRYNNIIIYNAQTKKQEIKESMPKVQSNNIAAF